MSQELAATRFLMEKLNAIESRLEYIERMLGAPACKTCNDTGEINFHIPHTMADSKYIACPDCTYIEWRPMSTAPFDKRIRVKISNVAASSLDENYRRWNQEKGLTAKYEHGLWKVEDYFLMIDKSFAGWRPL